MSEALQIMKECEAVLEGHFLLSSGRHSGIYCQCAKLQQWPDKAAVVMAPVADKLRELNIDVVVGPAMGGIVYAYELGRQLGRRAHLYRACGQRDGPAPRFLRSSPASAASSPRTWSPPASPAWRPRP